MVKKTRPDTRRQLQFSDKLVGKGHSTDALLKKIKTLHLELSEMDQELVDTSSLASVRKELISTSILLHKDKGVKAYAACCMADLLRLYAPDAPYTGSELKDMFQFFFRQLATGLKGSESPYYGEYYYLLESLSTIKSVVLVCDLPQADELMLEIFRTFFDLIRQDLPKNVEMFMTDILIAIIEESSSIPSDVLECILKQFEGKSANVEQPSYRLAVDVCNTTADRLQRNVCQYFTDIIIQHGHDEDFEEIQIAHELIKQLNRACPSLLLNVVPQLEEELRVDELQIRLMATQVLGEMFSDKGGAELKRKYPTTWSTWLARKNDKVAVVRVAFIEGTVYLLKLHPSLREEIEEALQSKIMDPDDKVRAAVCKVYGQIDYETALHHVGVEQLKELCGRFLDKKSSVRSAAFAAIGNLYRLAFPEIEMGDAATIEKFAWIPQQIVETLTISVDVRSYAEQVIAEHILPLSSKTPDEVAWTERLLTVIEHMETKAIVHLLALTSIKTPRPSYYEKFVECCVENNGGIIDENEEEITRRLDGTILHLSRWFPEPSRAAEDLHTYAKLNEARLYKLLKTSMDPQIDLQTLVKSTNDFLRKVEAASPGIVETMTGLIRFSSLWLINQSSIPTLIKRLQILGDYTGDHRLLADKIHLITSCIAKHCPTIFKPHVPELYKALNDSSNVKLVEVALQALAAVAQEDASMKPPPDSILRKCKAYVTGPNRRHAKFAARFLMHLKDSKSVCEELIENMWMRLKEAEEGSVVANIAALSEFAKSPSKAIEIKSDEMISTLVDVLEAPEDVDEDAMETEEDWSEEVSSHAQAKILILKVCTNRSLALATSESGVQFTTGIVRLMFTILDQNGSVLPDGREHPKVKSRLRLQAANSLLRLSSVNEYRKMVMPNFVVLALTMQDSCFQVREGFITKLTHYLVLRKLDPLFNVIAFLTPHDPEPEIRDKARQYITLAFKRSSPELKLSNFEMIFVRLLHLLAHHPDFAKTSESLKDIAQYIEFYLELIATADSISLLFYLAARGKTVRDAEAHTFNENLYAISELAQHIIKARANERSWPLTSYPGKVKLPGDIFKQLPNPEAGSKILKTTYLPIEDLPWISQAGKSLTAKALKARAPAKSPRKRKALASKTNGKIKRVRKSRRKTADSDDEDESSPTESGGENGNLKSEDTRTIEGEDDDESTSEEENRDNEDGAEKLGRGARGKAKARLKKAERKKTKTNSK